MILKLKKENLRTQAPLRLRSIKPLSKSLILLLTSLICHNSSIADVKEHTGAPKNEKQYYYVRVDTGVSSPIKKIALDDRHNKSPFISLGFGERINRFRYDLNLSHHYDFKYNSDGVLPEDGEKYSHKGSISSNALMLNGYYNIVDQNRFSIYVSGGAGAAHNVFKDHILLGNEFTPISVQRSKQKMNFAWNVGAGAAFHFTKFSLDLSYKYLDLGKISYVSEGYRSGINYPKESGKLLTHSINLGILLNI